MFSIQYRIIDQFPDDADAGFMGCFQILVNECVYGDFFPLELDDIMSDVWITDWFLGLIEAVIALKNSEHVYIHDIETLDVWIWFQRSEGDVRISLMRIYSTNTSRFHIGFIEFAEYLWWKDQVVSFRQFAEEVYEKSGVYLQEIVRTYPQHKEHPSIRRLTELRSRML